MSPYKLHPIFGKRPVFDASTSKAERVTRAYRAAEDPHLKSDYRSRALRVRFLVPDAASFIASERWPEEPRGVADCAPSSCDVFFVASDILLSTNDARLNSACKSPPSATGKTQMEARKTDSRSHTALQDKMLVSSTSLKLAEQDVRDRRMTSVLENRPELAARVWDLQPEARTYFASLFFPLFFQRAASRN